MGSDGNLARRTRKRGVERVGLSAILILSSYNLVRTAKLPFSS